MATLLAILGAALILEVLWEGFESIILSRRVMRRGRLVIYLFRPLWRPWKAVGRLLARKRLRETWLGFYGPLALLLTLLVWATTLVAGFALIYRAVGPLGDPARTGTSFLTDLYFSCTTFFTLGLGDVVPRTSAARFFTAIEGTLGFGFLALIISYLPSISQSFSRREVSISLLDARAGSPPSAAEVLRRHGNEEGMEALRQLLQEWELWSAELLESHLSHPALAYFRSQHTNQSWLGALTAVLDTCALVMALTEGHCKRQAELTFAMARHAVVDIASVFRKPPHPPAVDRLPPETLVRLREALSAAGVTIRAGREADEELARLRRMYEPYVYPLAVYFDIDVPPWVLAETGADNWQVSEWEHPTKADRGKTRIGGA